MMENPPSSRFVCVLAFRERKPLLRRKPRPDGKRRLPILRRRKPRPPKPPKQNKFVLIYNKRRGWELPGGQMNEGETPEQAAGREFLEETGYEVAIVDKIPMEKGEYFIGKLGRRRGMPQDEDVKELKFCLSLPSEGLAFPVEEYAELIKIARGKGY